MGFITNKPQTSVASNNKGCKPTRDSRPHGVTREQNEQTLHHPEHHGHHDKGKEMCQILNWRFRSPTGEVCHFHLRFIGWSQSYDESFLRQIGKFNPTMCLEGRESEIFVNRTSIYYPENGHCFLKN